MPTFKPIALEQDMAERLAGLFTVLVTAIDLVEDKGPDAALEQLASLGGFILEAAMLLYPDFKQLQADACVLLFRVKENNPLFSFEASGKYDQEAIEVLRSLGRDI